MFINNLMWFMHGLIWLRGDEHSLGRNEEWLSALDWIPNTLIRPGDEQHIISV